MSHIIIGTAGHVDHGKTMLIRALTGKDTDRLREEKERGISIDLGFAPFDLPGGRRAGVVDVPGHERFINNMLAGIGGIDLVLLVVDVTEGVMPQTREHLAILNLLAIKKGIVVLTKIDLAETEWVDLVQEEVYRELKGTFLAEAPCRRVSATTGAGIEDLKALIDRETTAIAVRDADAPLRMPVDRVFSLAGFGTIVTGTLIAGKVKVGAEVEVLPAGRKARVRRIQVHGAGVEEVFAGQRAALNLAHLEKEEVSRGSVVASPGFYQPTSLLDVRLRLLPTALQSLKNMAPLHLYLGTARVVARALLLDDREIRPGENGLVQLKLERQLVAQNSDRFIVRSYSPVTTIGGGVVLDHLPLRHKRFRPKVIENLKHLEEGDASGYLISRIREEPLLTSKELARLVRLSPERMREFLDLVLKEGKVVDLDGHLVLKEKYGAWVKELYSRIEEFHRLHNLAAGPSRASLKGALGKDFPTRAYDVILENLTAAGKIVIKGEIIAAAGFKAALSPEQSKMLAILEDAFLQGGFSPPAAAELKEKLALSDEQLQSFLAHLKRHGVIVKVSDELAYHKEIYDEALHILKHILEKEESITLARFRDALNTSRKYAQALLEHYDGQKITRRKGDYRILW